MDARVEQAALFDAAPPLPNGLVYRPGFLTEAEESALVSTLGRLPFREATYQQYLARRRVVLYGRAYDDQEREWQPAEPLPPVLERLRAKVAQWVDVAPDDFVHVLATEYRPGTPIGWHRDAPMYGFVVGVSLAGACRMRFRPLDEARHDEVFALELQPRSLYVMRDDIRWFWQHNIPPVKATRYSITLRTLRDDSSERGQTRLRRI
jgi:alkylated DNA repair dioxygenase AlkB